MRYYDRLTFDRPNACPGTDIQNPLWIRKLCLTELAVQSHPEDMVHQIKAF